MTKLSLLLTIFLMSCSPYKSQHKIEQVHISKPILARITYYWPGDSGQKGFQTSTGNIAKCGKTVAVDPNIIPYGSKVYIPQMDKVCIAHDTGSAVKKRTASKKVGKNNIVIDVFCGSKYKAYERIKKYPMFMEIKIENPIQ